MTLARARSPRSARSSCRSAAPGILSGIVLVFIPIMGEYLIPILLGGGGTEFFGNALADLFSRAATGRSVRRSRRCSLPG